MHAWVFRHLDQLRPIYERECEQEESPEGSPKGGAEGLKAHGVQLAPGTAQRIPGAEDVTVAPMPRAIPPRGPSNTPRNR